MTGDTIWQSVAELSRRLRRRELSARELMAACLRRIEIVNPAINAFITVRPDQALEQADLADREMARGHSRGPLHGIPYAVKDVIATQQMPTTNGSLARLPVPNSDAAVVSRLGHAGAILVGKLNLWELAMTGAAFGEVRNPWDLRCSAGGSSGGSAAAVAAGLIPFALGTDTGGSIRVPSAHCGVVGLRPTYGRVSREGVTPNCWSVDTVGPLARTVEDIGVTFRAMCGGDEPAVGETARGAERVVIGVVREAFDRAHPDVERSVTAALHELEGIGARLMDVTLPHAGLAAAVRTLHLAEAAAFHEQRVRDPQSGLGPRIRARLEEALTFPAVDYLRALRLRQVLIDETEQAFRRCDLLALPTDGGLAAPLEDGGLAATGLPTSRPNTFLASMTGDPALSVPCGFSTGTSVLPISLMLQAPPHQEKRLLRTALRYQQATGWHTRRPEL